MARPHLRKALGLLAAGAVALALAGCASTTSSTSTDAPAAAAGEGFPLTIPSALGDGVIESQPTRIATWGWGATDAVLALGIVPVAIPSDDYSGGDDKIAPWVSEKLDQLGGEAPTILDNSTYQLSVEELLATNPDVLLAPYSGMTQEEFDAVTAAGIPVVAYPDGPWTTPWRDVVSIVGEALGMTAEADEVLAGLETMVSDAAAANPEFAGTTVAIPADSAGTYSVYLPADSRVELLENLGFVSAPGIAALDTGESLFYTTVSPENLDQIDAQVVLVPAESQTAMDAFLTSDAGKLIPAVQTGAVAQLVGPEALSALSPTPLTLPWGLASLTEQLAAATKVAKG